MLSTPVDVAFTGHRPPKGDLTFGGDGPADRAADLAVHGLLDGAHIGFAHVGGALGFDWIATRVCYRLQIPFVLHLPFEGHHLRWPTRTQERFGRLREAAHETIVYGDQADFRMAFQDRNIGMIEAAHDTGGLVVAWWDGSSGGTANAIFHWRRLPQSEVISSQLINLYPLDR